MKKKILALGVALSVMLGMAGCSTAHTVNHNGIHMALVSKTVSDIPFSDIENYIIVFKGTSYGDPYTRIMAFPMSQSSAPKWGMVFWDSSRIVWV